MPTNVIERIHHMAAKKYPDRLFFLHSNNMSIRAPPPPNKKHNNMTAASEGVDKNPVNENEKDSDLSSGDNLDDDSGISSGANSDDDPTDKAFVDATDESYVDASEN